MSLYVCVCVKGMGGGRLPFIGFAQLHLFGPRLAPVFSKRTPLQMCSGSRVAAMYSKSASEGSSICGVEQCGVVSPGHRYKRKFILLSSHEVLQEGGEVVQRRRCDVVCGGLAGEKVLERENSKLKVISLVRDGGGLLMCTKGATKCLNILIQKVNELSWQSGGTVNEQQGMT